MITGYKLEFSNSDSTHYNLIINTTDVHIIENDSIYCWSTHELSEGEYILWLTTYVNGDSAISGSRKISLNTPTKVVERNRQSYCYRLEQNYPNPFNSQTVIQYQLPVQTHVKIKIYDLLGQDVRTLIDISQPVGHHSAIWDGKNNSGQNVGSGLYIYKFITPEFVRKRKILLVK